MKPNDILRLAFAAVLTGAAITTVLAGSYGILPDPYDLFYKGSLCRHSPAALKQ